MKKTLVTHNGTFHADDVFAVATFLLAHEGEEWKVIRSREGKTIEDAHAVIDTGHIHDPNNLRFDHHQESGAGVRDNGIPYAAFGLVWKEYGQTLCGGVDMALSIDKKLVAPMDAHDNGINLTSNIFEGVFPYDISTMVQSFNLTWLEEEAGNLDGNRLEVFKDLVDLAKKIILREIKRVQDKKSAGVMVSKLYLDATDKRVIILDKYYPWQDILISYNEPLFVIYPNPNALTWSVKAVPKEKNSFICRKYFPDSWAGKENTELEGATQIPGAVFCHRNKFLVITKTKESAIEVANQALK